ncbi:MAG: hypothetical protein COV44_10485 [Deltaproteobacteria bacterium CG11_big_fil_rev_8_21_14_0_20_45_16]|nr:MAG: hypothetical protein COV44_10485 [Deltaproteobacteria bacterium CG11_big_fil_rev_8_21_14_0_20_45_16]
MIEMDIIKKIKSQELIIRQKYIPTSLHLTIGTIQTNATIVMMKLRMQRIKIGDRNLEIERKANK